MRELGVEPIQVIRAIEKAVGRGDRPPYGKPTLAPRTKRVIELAVEEARLMGHQYIGTEHLLLGLVREGEGIAVNVLRSLGVSLDKVRTQTARSLLESEQHQETKRQESKTPLIDQLGLDLTQQAEEGKLDPVIGRQKEIERVIQILSRRTKNNPALIGEPGVGKTAIVEGLAQRIVAGDAPESLLDKRLLMLDVGSLVAGTMYRGQFEERLKKVIEEIKDSGAILFIDEVHMLVGAGSAGSAVDAANILKPALARGEVQCIGATTLDEYRRYIEGDASLERRFQPVLVEEPSIEETVTILQGVRPVYEEHHRLEITNEALEAAAHAFGPLRARPLPARQGHRPGGRGSQPGAHVQVARGGQPARGIRQFEGVTEGKGRRHQRRTVRRGHRPALSRGRAAPPDGSDAQRLGCAGAAATRHGRGHSRGGGDVDRRPCAAHRRRGKRASAADGEDAARAGCRPGRSSASDLQGCTPGARRASRIRSDPSAPSCCWDRRASAKRCWPRRWPSICLAATRRSSSST